MARQKLIRIADRSELRWGVVAKYTADELADDSGDENRIERVEKEAERKAGKRKKRAEQILGAAETWCSRYLVQQVCRPTARL